ncbi:MULTISPECIES: hypothetical protein [Clostridium]|nr:MULTISPECIES: hypothetical protein [Clostridium]EDS78119.1 conserved hypothetical protein [Clostridium botulinum C str. Eklund]
MKNLIRKGITAEYFYYGNWSYFFSAGYFCYSKTKIPISNEFNDI